MPVHITYRTNETDAKIASTPVANKNGPLSNVEIDGNFKSLKTAVDSLMISAGFSGSSTQYTASMISFVPVSNITAMDVQGAIQEVNNEAIGKQPMLVSGTTIKTVEGQSLLGAGDIDLKQIAGQSILGAGSIDFKTINSNTIVGVGDIPVKTINGNNIFGSGDISITPSLTSTDIKSVGGQSLIGSGDVAIKTVNGTPMVGSGDISFKTINGTPIVGSGDIVVAVGSGYATTTDLLNKQDVLKDSGVGANIKTIEGTSILGSGNIDFVSINGQSILGTGNIAISNINDATTGTGSTWSSTKLTAELSGKQATLVSGTTLKSIEGQSLLGAGDIDLISINGTSLIGNTNLVVSIIDDAGTGTNVALSASKVNTLLTAKQNTLVSGTNIKTLDSASLLGSGNISIKSFNGTSIIGTGNIDVAIIDDTVAASNSLWSSQKVNQELAKKQATLISGTGTGANIKSLGGNSLLGAGDISLATINGTSLIGTSINFATPVINDSATSGTGLWSSQKVSTELALKGDVSYSGTGTFTNKTAESLILTKGYTETVYTATTGATFELNPLNGSIQNLTLGANTTITLAAGFASGQSVTIAVQTTTNTITWPAAILWIGGVAPTMDATRNNIFVVWKVGTAVYGLYVGKA